MEDRGMKYMMFRRPVSLVALVALPLFMGGCLENKEQTAEIKRLKEATEDLEYDLKDMRQVKADADKRIGELRDKLNATEKKLYLADRELNTAKRELERYKEKERRAEEAKKREPTRSEKIVLTKKAVEKQLSAMISVAGDKTSGSGILVEEGGKTWLYVPAGVISGNSKLEITTEDGETLKKFGAFEVATGSDLARLEVLEPPEAKLTLSGKAVDFSQGSTLLGVNDSSQLTDGRAYNVKTDLIETDSGISSCPPGSPVFHGESGALVGIVTDPLASSRDLWRNDGEGYGSPRRVVTRLDRKIRWTAVPIGTFIKESMSIEQADSFTRLINAFIAIEPSSVGMNFNAGVAGSVSARDILEENKSLSVVRSLQDLNEWLTDSKTKKLSPKDVNRRVISVLDQMANEARRQSKAFLAIKFSPYHRAAAKESLQWRKEAMDRLNDMIIRVKEEK
jgi:hypothetical protein